MMRSAIFLTFAVGLALTIGCATVPEEPQIDLAAEKEAAAEVNRVWLDLARAKDAKGIGDLFVEDGWTISGTDGLTEGRAAIVARQQEGMDNNPDQVDDWGQKEIWVSASGDLAVERGWWRNDPDGDGEAAIVEGEYVTVMIKVDGEWKVLADAGAPIDGISAP